MPASLPRVFSPTGTHLRRVSRHLFVCLLIVSGSCERSQNGANHDTNPQIVEILAPPQLQPILTTLGQTYQAQHDIVVFVTTGSAQQLEQQIATGIQADVLIVQTPERLPPTEGLAGEPTPWIGERLVLIQHEDAPPITLEQIPDIRGTISVVSETRPIGLYSRLALRVVNLWNALETRVRQRSSPQEVVSTVISKQDRFGIVYASHIPQQVPLRILADLELPEAVQVRYELLPLSQPGIAMAAWLLSEEALQLARDAGYAR